MDYLTTELRKVTCHCTGGHPDDTPLEHLTLWTVMGGESEAFSPTDEPQILLEMPFVQCRLDSRQQFFCNP